MQQGHEVGRYAAQALLYYKGGMPSATTSLIKVHPGYSQEPSRWNSQNHEPEGRLRQLWEVLSVAEWFVPERCGEGA